MRHTHDPGTTNCTEGAHAANKRSMPQPTEKYNAGIQSSRLINRQCTSLDLETVFKRIDISKDIVKEVCKQCRFETCKCPAFMPGTLCSSASSSPTNISDEQIPELVANKSLQALHILVQSPSDEEVDREVASICRAPEYYRVRLHVCRRRQYFMYHALDDIEETIQQKCHRKCAGTTC